MPRLIIDPAGEVANASTAVLAAAAGWLGGCAMRQLGDRVFLDRVVDHIATRQKPVTIEFLFTLERDIRAACRIARVAAPDVQDFFRPAPRDDPKP
jgi:hypothetical protein